MRQTEKRDRLLLTGAAGGLGKVLRESLKPFARVIRLSDLAAMSAAGPGEEVEPCDLADKAAVDRLVHGCDAIVHMGGVSIERPFEEILEANIKGVFHVYEGARRQGVKRVVFASSNHVIGFHKQDEVLDADSPRRPDSYYGLSKAYGEDLSRFYFDRYGIETACLRIGSSFPEPKDRRMLSTWLSYRDLTELVRCCLFAPELGHTVVYGMSANRDIWWDNSKAAHLGFHPKDSSEPFRAKVEPCPRWILPIPLRSTRAAPSSRSARSRRLDFDESGTGSRCAQCRRRKPGLAGVGAGALLGRHHPRKLYRWQAASGQRRSLDGPGDGGLHRPAPGRRLAVRDGVRLVPDAGRWEWLARRPKAGGGGTARPGMRFNDGRCDRQGRMRAGTMLMDMAQALPVGVLYGLEANGELKTIMSGLIVPNGLAFSPDGRTMYLSDSHPSVQQIWAFRLRHGNRHTLEQPPFRRHEPLPGRPDGAAVDEDGCYWICGNDAGMIHRFTPAGKLDRSLELPVKKPAMCAFGGPGLDTLYVTSIRPDNIDLSDQPLAGGLFALRPGVRGLPEPACIH
jgi:uronate dehydrogenase